MTPTTSTPTETAMALRFQNVTKRFGDQAAVDGVDLDIAEGEWVTLLGPSGSGKTTLLRILAGFESATSGSVLLQGEDVSRLTPAERNIGMVFQQYALFPHLTVAENIGYGLKMHGWDRARRAARIEEMLDLIQLSGYGERMPRQLSGGQQQRVALARALAFGPRVLLMDEPLGALDRSLRLEMEQQFRRIHRELKPTVIYVTHDQEEALVLSDRIAILQHGKLIAFDTPRNLHDQPRTASVASFFAGADLLPAEHAVTSAGVEVTLFGQKRTMTGSSVGADDPVLLSVPPTSWRRRVAKDAWRVAGRVTDIGYLGDVTQLTVALAGSGQPVKVRMSSAEAADIEVEQELTLGLAPTDARLVVDDRR